MAATRGGNYCIINVGGNDKFAEGTPIEAVIEEA